MKRRSPTINRESLASEITSLSKLGTDDGSNGTPSDDCKRGQNQQRDGEAGGRRPRPAEASFVELTERNPERAPE